MSAQTSIRPPSIIHVLETVLYVKNKEKSADFYKDIMGLKPFLEGVSSLPHPSSSHLTPPPPPSLPSTGQIPVQDLIRVASLLGASRGDDNNSTPLLTPSSQTQPSITGFALPNSCLLLFQLGLTSNDKPLPAEGPSTGLIPGDGPTKDLRDRIFADGSDNSTSSSDAQAGSKLRQHFCLAVHERGDVDKWEKWFEEKGVEITGRVIWERGGRSVYFNDPDGHVGEVASRGVWPHY